MGDAPSGLGSSGHPMANTAGLRTIRARTTFASLDQFVTSFAPYVDETSVFVATPAPLELGSERQFVFQLADGTAVLQGRGTVVEATSDGSSPGGRKGMRIELAALTPRSRDVHRALLAAQKLPAFPHPNTVPRERPGTPLPEPLPPLVPLDRVPPPPEGPSGSWNDEVTRPGEPADFAAMIEADRRVSAAEPGRPPPTPPASAKPPPLPPPRAAGPPANGPRAPRSPHTLPANPLAELADQDLRSFVECTLTEDSGPFPMLPEVDLGAPDAAVDPEPFETLSEGIRHPGEPSRRRVLLCAIALAASGGIGLGYSVGRAPASGSTAAVSTEAKVVAEEAPAAPTPLAIAASAGLAAPPAAEAPAAAPERCRGRVVTIPDGIDVRWGDAALGSTPLLDVEVPCGAAEVVLSHRRYEPVTRAVTATADSAAALEVTMKRPAGTLSLRSTPPGATIEVDGVAIGRGPIDVPVRAYSHVEVKATLAGHRPWSRQVYVKGPHHALVVDLQPLPRRSKPRTTAKSPGAVRPETRTARTP
jgi:PEGA domain-containing protein